MNKSITKDDGSLNMAVNKHTFDVCIGTVLASAFDIRDSCRIMMNLARFLI